MAFEATKKVRYDLAVTGEGRLIGALRNVAGGFVDTGRAAGLARTAFAGLAGVASVVAFAGLVNGAIDAKAKLYDLGLQTGISVERLGGLAKVAQFSDTNLAEVASASAKLSKALATTSEDGKGAAQALKALGIAYEPFKQLGADEQLLAVANAMAQFEDGTEKTAAAMLLFGKSGAALLPFLTELSERGIEASAQTTESARAAKLYQDNLVALRGAGETWATTFATQMLPALVALTDEFVKVKGEAGEANIVITALKVTFETLAVLGANVAFMFGAAGRSIGAFMANRVAMFKGDGAAMKAIDAEVEADNQRARAQLDAFERRLLGIEAIKARVADAGDFLRSDKDSTRVARPRLGDLSGADAAAAKKHQDELLKIAQQAANARSALRQAEEQAILDFERAEDQRRNNEVRAAQNALAAAQAEFDQYGLLRSQIAELTLQRLRDKQAAFAAGSENSDAVQREIDAQRELVDVLRRGEARDEKFRTDPAAGAQRAVKDYLRELGEARIATERVVGNAARGLEDGLTQLFTTGRWDARRFIDDLIGEFFRLQVVRPLLKDLFSGLGGGGGGGGSGGDLLGSLVSFFNPGAAPQYAGLGGGAGNFNWGGGLAVGGPARPDTAYLVGERGPEIFVPQTAGTVLPNGAGGTTIQIHQAPIHIDARSDRAQVAVLVSQAVAQGNRALIESLRARGALA